MMTEDQAEIIAYLSEPSTHGTPTVERLETHASVVFLAGDHALKLKRAVRYDYLDYSTCERRHRMCEAELLLNRRFAPSIYDRLVPVTREADGRLALAGRGAVVEWLLRMHRFDQEALLDRLAAEHALPLDLMRPLGRVIAQQHVHATPLRVQGGVAAMSRVVEGNARSFAEARGVLDQVRAQRLVTQQRAALIRQAPRLEARRAQGLVRHCHGDLHLGNLVLLDGTPTPFDGIEFSDDLACIDVQYDLAFLLMDLWRLGLRTHANAAWNAYLEYTTDFAGVPLLPLFLSCRAAVRAKTSLASASLASDAAARETALAAADDYLAQATAFLVPDAPCLVAIGGRSGSGKSSVAAAVAPELGRAPGAVVVRSDVLRKWLSGVDSTTTLDPSRYSEAWNAHVYAAVADRCRIAVECGQGAIADAVWGRRQSRADLRAVAVAAGVPFVGIWLEAPARVLEARVAGRRHDASDADLQVLARQAGVVDPPDDWMRVDASGPIDTVVAAVLAHVRAALPPTSAAGRRVPPAAGTTDTSSHNQGERHGDSA